MTIFGVLPPHSRLTRFMLDSPEYLMKNLPTSAEPVKATQSTSMWRPRAWPAVSPKPGSTFSTPSGTPASAASSAARIVVSGVCSAGLTITELPAASAGPIFQAAIMSGKFHGTTAATTPTGSRVISASASAAVGAISSYTLSTASAYQRIQAAEAGMSMEEASRIGLPMSRVSSRASSVACLRIRSANLSRILLRLAGAMLRQRPSSKARRAAATARSTSSAWHEATWASTRPLAGLTQSNVAPLAASTYLPSMNAWWR